MRIRRIEAGNFLAYEDLELDLADAHLVGVVGPNGSGKSSLLDAVRFALFGTGRGSADEMIHNEAESAMVSVTLSINDRLVRITRNRSRRTTRGESTLTLQVDDENRTGHTMAETQVAIEKLLGLTEDALLAGPFMVQNGSDELMRLTASQRKDLLVRLFGLDRFEAYASKAKSLMAAAQMQQASIEGRLAAVEDQVAGELETKRLAKEKATELKESEARAEDLAERITVLREEAAVLLERQRRSEQLDREIAGLDAQYRYDQTEAEKIRLPPKPLLPPEIDRADTEARLAKVIGSKNELLRLTGERATLEGDWKAHRRNTALMDKVPCQHLDLRSMEEDREPSDAIEGTRQMVAEKCLSCQFLVDARTSREALPEVERMGREVAEAIGLVAADAKLADTLAEQLSSVIQQQAAFDVDQVNRERKAGLVQGMEITTNRIGELNAERLRLRQDVTKQSETAATLGQLALDLEFEKTNMADCRQAIAGANAELARIRQAKQDLTVLREARDTAAADIQKWALLARAFHRDGIPTLILENGIPQIEQRANEVLARLPGSWQVVLATQRDKKTGGVRETLDVVLTSDGRERPYGLLSGGERFRVDFALRMALAAVLARRAGIRMGTLWLDEGWGSQDKEGRDALLESIGAVADDFELVMIVSHVPEVTDRMPQRLEVSKEDGASTARLVA